MSDLRSFPFPPVMRPEPEMGLLLDILLQLPSIGLGDLAFCGILRVRTDDSQVGDVVSALDALDIGVENRITEFGT